MEVHIGNLMPGETCKVRFSICEELTPFRNKFWRLIIPSCLTPRYRPEYLNSNSNSNSEFDFIQSSSFGKIQWTITVEVCSHSPISLLECPTHELDIIQSNTCSRTVSLKKGKNHYPDKDFVLLYSCANIHIPNLMISKYKGTYAVVTSFIPKLDNISDRDALNDPLLDFLENSMDIDISSQKGDFVILVDCSGSMEGRINLAKEALIFFLKSLPFDSYFNVYLFGSEFVSLFPGGSQKYSDTTLKNALDFGQGIDANMGGTEILKPLLDIFKKKNY
jgi:von Willebrand factor A domain-containing protein 5